MIIQDNRGVNFCTCKICGASFLFDRGDIKRYTRISNPFPFVRCPHCKHEMNLGYDRERFKYVKINECKKG